MKNDDDIVSPNGLATHLGMSRQNVARLTAEAVIEQRSDGRYDLTASRLRYIKHLRALSQRSPRVEADAEHAAAKAEMMQLRIAERRKQLMETVDAVDVIDGLCGLFLTGLSELPAHTRDLKDRVVIDRAARDLRQRIADTARQKAQELTT
jgi:hypothetical protein